MMSRLCLLALLLLVGACSGPVLKPKIEPSQGHLRAPEKPLAQPFDAIPEPTAFAAPTAAAGPLYDIVAVDVDVRSLLLQIAADSGRNMDIAEGVSGQVTMHAQEQTLEQLLQRLAEQLSLRYRIDGQQIQVFPDIPHMRFYTLDYLDLHREMTSHLQTEVAATALLAEGSGNRSETRIENSASHDLWESITRVLQKLLNVADGSSDVIVNREAGYLALRGTARQHRLIADYLAKIQEAVRRQVLIEATLVEVQLSDQYQTGVDWSAQRLSETGWSISQSTSSGALNAASNGIAIGYADPTSALGNIVATIKALEEFGQVRVLSSPKIIALNNQPAVLKVVENEVYFLIDVTTTLNENNVQVREEYSSQPQNIPVGFVMTVLPQINADEEVLLNVRPTISRVIGYVDDPNPKLTEVPNRMPRVQVREMEALLRVKSGHSAVIGGLMQDRSDQNRRGIPVLGQLPFAGRLFSYRSDSVVKTELLIFLRPTVIRRAGIAEGDQLERFRDYLPSGGMPSGQEAP